MKLLSIGSTRRSRSRGRGATSSERGTMRRPSCGTAVARPEASLTLSPHSCVVATSPQWCISSRSTCAWWSVIPASCSDVSSISDSASGSISGGPHRKTCNGVSHMNPECAGGASHLWRVTAVGSVLKAALALRFTSVIRGSSIGPCEGNPSSGNGRFHTGHSWSPPNSRTQVVFWRVVFDTAQAPQRVTG